ncbi:MAG: flippase-like domain-containing protein [Gemmatimonadetes bacterium]|nr:flippase-like domain-containing protein [Gemmatimonadota bacterium]
MKHLVRALGLAILVWLIWRHADFGEVATSLRLLTAPAVLGLLAVAIADRIVMALKWRHVSSPLDIHLPLGEWISAMFAGSFVSNALPSTLGGDVYRGWRVARGGTRPSLVVASLVAERIIGVLATILIAWAGLAWLVTQGIARDEQPAFLGLFAITCVLLFLFGVGGTKAGREAAVAVATRVKAGRPARKLADAISAYDGHARLLFVNLLLALFENIFPLALLLGAASALHVPVEPLSFLAIAAVALFLQRGSMVLDGWGVGEALRLVTYGLIGVSASDTVAIALVAHSMGLLATFPGAIVFLRDPNRAEATADVPAKAPGRIGLIIRRFLVPAPLVAVWYYVRDGAKISFRAEVELSPNLKFGPGCTVSSFTKIKATDGPLVIGAHTGFATGCFVSSGEKGLHIGDHVLFGPNVTVLASHYVHGDLTVPFEDQGVSSKGVKIGSNVWLGAGTVVADGASIGDNTIVVANSLVNRRYPPNVIIQGTPAKVILRRGTPANPEEATDRS